MRIWLNLFANSLIPAFAPEGSTPLRIPPIPLDNPAQIIDRASKTAESGFFSAFTSYISSYAADDPPEPSDEEVNNTGIAVDCIKQCRFGDVFANILSVAPLVDIRMLSYADSEQQP